MTIKKEMKGKNNIEEIKEDETTISDLKKCIKDKDKRIKRLENANTNERIEQIENRFKNIVKGICFIGTIILIYITILFGINCMEIYNLTILAMVGLTSIIYFFSGIYTFMFLWVFKDDFDIDLIEMLLWSEFIGIVPTIIIMTWIV